MRAVGCAGKHCQREIIAVTFVEYDFCFLNNKVNKSRKATMLSIQ